MRHAVELVPTSSKTGHCRLECQCGMELRPKVVSKVVSTQGSGLAVVLAWRGKRRGWCCLWVDLEMKSSPLARHKHSSSTALTGAVMSSLEAISFSASGCEFYPPGDDRSPLSWRQLPSRSVSSIPGVPGQASASTLMTYVTPSQELSPIHPTPPLANHPSSPTG